MPGTYQRTYWSRHQVETVAFTETFNDPFFLNVFRHLRSFGKFFGENWPSNKERPRRTRSYHERYQEQLCEAHSPIYYYLEND